MFLASHVAPLAHRALSLASQTLQFVAASIVSPQDDAGIEFFEKQIRPALAKHCYKCHSATAANPKGGLLLDSPAGLLNGGQSGKAVVAGQVSESLLVQAI